jgi:hypothetical protein
MAESLIGEFSADDDAVDQTATTPEDEGAFDPLEVLDQLDAPEDEADEEFDADGEEGDDSTDEPVDYKSLYETEQAKIAEREAAIATKESEVERQEQLRLMKQAEQAWKQEEAQAIQWAVAHPNHREAIAGIQQYYTNKIDTILRQSQAIIQQAYTGQFIDQVSAQTGLTADDTALLRTVDPKHAPALAQALAAKNKALEERFSKIESQTQNLARGRQAQRRTLTGADRISSSRSTGTPGQRIQYGSVDNALFLLQARDALNGKNR